MALVAAFGFATNAQVSKNENAARKWITDHSKELGIKDYHTFKLNFVKKSLAGETLRFQQMINNVPVYHSEIVVHFNQNDKLSFTSESFDAAAKNITTTPSLSTDAALTASKESLKLNVSYTVDEKELIVAEINDQTKLVYRIVTNPANGKASWEVLVDAQTGTVLSTKDVAIYHRHEKNSIEQPKKTNSIVSMAPFAFVTGTAMVYLSDPLSAAHVAYGATGYVDGNDANTTQLAAARTAVTLPEIDLTAGIYKLKSSYVQIGDFETPNKGLFTRATSDFNFTRDNDGFEAVNVFYQLDKSLRYINETLGIVCKPSLNSGVLLYDPSGLDGDDNSHYVPSTERIAFGEGCVDDAEDADVIWHEFGHGVHDWLTNGSTSPYIGEGNGDYWAQSYSRSLNQWTSSDAAYNYMFSWDGHNTCWDGRTTNYAALYPGGLVGLQGGAAHTDGQIWATVLMKIWDAIGREKTDKMFLEGLVLTNSSSNQQNSARALRQAAIDMRYSCADVRTITQKFTAAGYTMPALLVVSAPETETVTVDAEGNYILGDFTSETIVYSPNCDVPAVQSPPPGTVFRAGTYVITMTSGTASDTFTLVVEPALGLNDNARANDIVVYPNPAVNEITIKGNLDTTDSISIYNMLGQKVIEKAIDSKEQKVDVSKLQSGVYTINFNNSKFSYKFVKN
ncbi:hypothetical protein FNO01nite_23640 [Flavobacterium noncentrifugens]|nr:hypothetical protein FNO01nite_23640 [Flavobacterium noncentrifugens]